MSLTTIAALLIVVGMVLSFIQTFYFGVISCLCMVSGVTIIASMVSLMTHLLLAAFLAVFGGIGAYVEHSSGHWDTPDVPGGVPYDHAKGFRLKWHTYYRHHAARIGSLSVVSIVASVTLFVFLAIRYL